MRLAPLGRCAAMLAGIVLAPIAAHAQAGTSTFSMTAEGVVDVAMSGSGLRDLEFGVVTPGVAKTVDVTSVSAAKWRFANVRNNNGVNNRFADLVFLSLPAALQGPDGATLAVTGYTALVCLEKPADSDYYCYPSSTLTSASPTIDPNPQINPTGGGGLQPPTAPGGNTGRSLVVYLGATVVPAVDQPSGTYLGTVTLTLNTSGTV